MGANRKTKSRKQRKEENTLMVVSSEDVISVWPPWVKRQCSTVLVCPCKVARSFPEGTSSTWEEETNTSIQININKTESLQPRYRLCEALIGTVVLFS